MKLYTSVGAVSPARVLFFLGEKGIEIERVQIDLLAGAHRTPEFRALSPNGRTPVLQFDDGSVLCESMAICRWFEEQQPDPPLFGCTPLERAQVEMWNRMMELDLLLPMAMTFRHTFPAMKALEDQVPEFGEKQRLVGQRRMRRLDEHLAGRDYIVGDTLTVADITAWCALRFFRVAGFAIGEEHKALQSWFLRIKERPAAAAAFR